MTDSIRIGAALIDDGEGRIFLVRKRGTPSFMQAGGKIDRGETALQALIRELGEELDFSPCPEDIRFLGAFSCAAANEPDRMLEAQLFHIRAPGREFRAGAELEEAIWVAIEAASELQLAPFTRDHVVPLARAMLG